MQLPPPPDPEFTAQVVEVLEDQADRYSLLILDLSDPAQPRFASHRAGEKQNVGSVGKLLAAHGLFSALADAWPDDLEARARVLRETEVVADAFSQTDHHKIRIVDPAAGTLTYATAGHPPPIVVTPAEFDPVIVGTAPPLGAGAGTGQRQTTIPFPREAVACFYTDGLAEARTTDGRLGTDRLGQIVRELGPDITAEQVIDRVSESARTITDDAAVCILAAEGGAGIVRARVASAEPKELGAALGAAMPWMDLAGRQSVALRRRLYGPLWASYLADPDHVHRRVRLAQVLTQPGHALLRVAPRVAVAGLGVAVREVRHGQPHVDRRREPPVGELRPQRRVDHLGLHRRIDDGAEGTIRAEELASPLRELDDAVVAQRNVGNRSVLEVERDRVEPAATGAQRRDPAQHGNVGFDLGHRREVPGDDLETGFV